MKVNLSEAMLEPAKVHPSVAMLAHLSVATKDLVLVHLSVAMKEPVKVHPSVAMLAHLSVMKMEQMWVNLLVLQYIDIRWGLSLAGDQTERVEQRRHEM